jgi:hypothetical protein
VLITSRNRTFGHGAFHSQKLAVKSDVACMAGADLVEVLEAHAYLLAVITDVDPLSRRTQIRSVHSSCIFTCVV